MPIAPAAVFLFCLWNAAFNVCGSWQEWIYSKVWKGGRFLWPGSGWAKLCHLCLPDLWSCWREVWEDAGLSSSRGLCPSTAPLLLLLRNKHLRHWLKRKTEVTLVVTLKKYKFSEYPLSTTKAMCKSWHSFPIHIHSSAYSSNCFRSVEHSPNCCSEQS